MHDMVTFIQSYAYWYGSHKAWRSCVKTHAHATPAAAVWRRAERVQTTQNLPPISFSTDAGSINVEELADLFCQVASHAPGQSFGALPGRSIAESPPCSRQHRATGIGLHGSTSADSSRTSGGVGCNCGTPQELAAAKLRGALRRSHVCVAAFASEQHLPEHQHLQSRGLLADSKEGKLPPSGAWWPPAAQRQRQRRVLVGFARAVSDHALVATVHDVVVLPELQRSGLGKQLLDRLTKQLLRAGIVDVGLLAPDAAAGFFESCSFGPDPEESTAAVLTLAGEQRWRQPQWEFAPRPGLEELLLRVH